MLLDVRLYQIRSGKRDEFHVLVRDGTIPLAHRYGHVVKDFGPSSHDEDTYYLIRAFTHRTKRVATHPRISKGSEEWSRDFMTYIESYHTAVFPTSREAVDRLIEASAQGTV
jgi:hypothetical protein